MSVKNAGKMLGLIKRVFVIVADSVGIGETPDADLFGDTGSNTLYNISKVVGGIEFDALRKLGLPLLVKICGCPPIWPPISTILRLQEVSPGKDTTTGHWELMGIRLKKPFPTYPNGFPDEVIKPFEQKIGRKVLGNKPASGTEIIKELGEEHIKTGNPIVYTSGDSVFQIAAHEEVVPVETLYEWCKIARSILTGKHAVSRVIARPFIGKPGNFWRTPRRKDFSLPPPQDTLLDILKVNGFDVIGVGKIEDIFAHRGLTESYHTDDNKHGMNLIEKFILQRDFRGMLFCNLVDFDMRYGHRNNPWEYKNALLEFDRWLGGILSSLRDDDLFIIVADHGNDPTTVSTDHSREYVPLILYNKHIKRLHLGTFVGFDCLAKTIGELFGVDVSEIKGKSFLQYLF